jgi:DNA-binding CsgD family transcriptional regulator
VVVAQWPLVGREGELAELQRVLRAGREPGSVVVFGDAGVGKTRLVGEAVDTWRQTGAAVEWLRATEAARAIPLGSLAHLLAPGDVADQRDDLLHLVLNRLSQRVAGQGFLLAVDDAHLLDDVSVALLHLAVTQSPVRVLLSVRTGEPLSSGLVRLWKDELVVRVDVGPLSRDDTERLVLAVLGEGVPASLLDRIWQLSRGNALFVRELVTAAVERRAVGGRHAADRGPVVLSGRPHQRLRDLVDERIRLLAPAERAALEIVAVGERVPLEAAERLADPDDVAALERRGLVEVVDADGLDTVQVAHPLYGEVLAGELPRLRRRAVLRGLVGAVEALGSDDGGDGAAGAGAVGGDGAAGAGTVGGDGAAGAGVVDSLRLAIWRLESGAPGDPAQLLPLAREALGRLDHRLAERLALAAGGTERVDAGLVLAEALSGQGRMAETEKVLATLQPTDPEEVARVAIARASDRFLHSERSPEAYGLLDEAAVALAGHPAWEAECRSVQAQLLWLSLRLPEAGAIADQLLVNPELRETARVRAVAVAVVVRGAHGQLDEALGLLDDDVHAAAHRHRREVPYGDLQLGMARYQILYWAGRAHDLDAYTDANLGLDVDPPPPSLRGILSGFRGGALLVRGRAREALGELQRSVRTLAESDWFGQRPLAEAMRARAAVFAGELDVAAEALEAADAAYAADPVRAARTLPFIELSRAWYAAADGSTVDATGRLLRLAALMEHMTKPFAVEALHATVRLGKAAEALDGLARLSDQVDGPFVGQALRHARALVAGDADQLAAVGADFEAAGADLLAAEAYRSAANAYRREGRGSSTATTTRLVDDLLARCGDPRSPGLELVPSMGGELTEREREIATLAARGRTGPQIAEALFLSVRTVDTHLHRVYRKLMVEGRHQLAEALGYPDEGHDGGARP